MKHIQDETQDCLTKTRFFYLQKIESAFKSALTSGQFCELQVFYLQAVDGLSQSNFSTLNLL